MKAAKTVYVEHTGGLIDGHRVGSNDHQDARGAVLRLLQRIAGAADGDVRPIRCQEDVVQLISNALLVE